MTTKFPSEIYLNTYKITIILIIEYYKISYYNSNCNIICYIFNLNRTYVAPIFSFDNFANISLCDKGILCPFTTRTSKVGGLSPKHASAYFFRCFC